MARWDQILSLPVQNPTLPEFSSSDLVWSKVEGYRDNLDRLALIPYARVDDFVRGESSNKDCPTSFHVEARRRRKSKDENYKPKVDGILEYTMYWCSFGPDDNRIGGNVRPSRSTFVPKKNNAGRPNSKRGCRCHFIVKRLIAQPTVALVIYNNDKHVDENGVPCHGPLDLKSAGTRAMFAPYISEDLKLRVSSLLHVGVSVETIMQRHNESVARKQGGPSNRDDLLTHRYVRRLERSIRRWDYELDEDDDVSVGMWVESHLQSHVFFFQEFDPFALAIQTDWQLQQMIRFGNSRLLASDSRFGSNKLKYPIHSLVVFDSENKAIPVAWVITPRVSSGDSYRWMRALSNRVHAKDPTWKVAGFIVDDPFADIITIRDVFQCPVLLSFWRVRHAWHKNIIKRCLETETRVEITRHLGEVVDKICKRQEGTSLFESLMEDFNDVSPDFVDYLRAVWSPRIGCWTSALQSLPLASQESCAAMELYHYQMKCRVLLNERDLEVYQRLDWLVDKLGTKVHSYFWLDEYSGKDDFSRYWKEEWYSGLTCFRKALSMPDSEVIIVSGKSAKIRDTDEKEVHVVWNPGSQFGFCTCSWAQKGYICKHMIKLTLGNGNRNHRESASVLQYYQTLIDLLQAPPRDSLFRDYAVSLLASAEKQINALKDHLHNNESATDLEDCETSAKRLKI